MREISAATLKARVSARINELVAFEEHLGTGQYHVLRELQELVCAHTKWQIYRRVGNKWVWILGKPNPEDLSGCYCAGCGISSRQVNRAER